MEYRLVLISAKDQYDLKPTGSVQNSTVGTYEAALRRAEPLVSGTNAATLSFEPRRELGTDLEGSMSELTWFWGTWASSEGGEVNCEPERLLLVLPGGEVKLEVEYRLLREKTDEKEGSRRSGGVVGSL